MSLKVLSLLMKTSVLCIVLSANSWQPLIFLLSPQFCLSQNDIQVESPSFSLKWEVQTLYETTPGPPRPGLDRLQAASSPTTCCSFPSSIGPVQQPRGGQGDTCWVSVHRKATCFVPLITVNPDSCRVCYKQTSHFFRPPALSTPHHCSLPAHTFLWKLSKVNMCPSILSVFCQFSLLPLPGCLLVTALLSFFWVSAVYSVILCPWVRTWDHPSPCSLVLDQSLVPPPLL